MSRLQSTFKIIQLAWEGGHCLIISVGKDVVEKSDREVAWWVRRTIKWLICWKWVFPGFLPVRSGHGNESSSSRMWFGENRTPLSQSQSYNNLGGGSTLASSPFFVWSGHKVILLPTLPDHHSNTLISPGGRNVTERSKEESEQMSPAGASLGPLSLG